MVKEVKVGAIKYKTLSRYIMAMVKRYPEKTQHEIAKICHCKDNNVHYARWKLGLARWPKREMLEAMKLEAANKNLSIDGAISIGSIPTKD